MLSNIGSMVMALMVLLSTVSWTVDKHLCMGRVMDISLFVHAEDCGMEKSMEAMEMDSDKNHCCDDETFTLKGQDNLKLTWDDFELEQQAFLVTFAISYSDLLLPIKDLPVPNEKYPPPILVKDIQVLDQTFLI